MKPHPNEEIMRQLIHQQWHEHSICAGVVTSTGEMIAIGQTTVDKDCDPTAHAEINAIRQACRKLKVSRLPSSYWLYSTFEPCPLCTSAAIWAGVEGIVYANNPDFRGKLDNWSFITCEEVLEKGKDIHEVKLVKDFLIDEIKGYFTRHDS